MLLVEVLIKKLNQMQAKNGTSAGRTGTLNCPETPGVTVRTRLCLNIIEIIVQFSFPVIRLTDMTANGAAIERLAPRRL